MNFSSFSSGGRKTCTKPSRACTTNAVRAGASRDRPRPPADDHRLGQRRSGPGVGLLAGEVGISPRECVERQPGSGRRVARNEHQAAASGPPGRARPAFAEPGRHQRKHPGGRLGLAAVQLADQLSVGQLWIEGRSRPAGWLTSAASRASGSSKAGCSWSSGSPKSAVIARASRSAEASASGSSLGWIERVGEQCRIAPQLLAVAPPDQADLPARQRLTGIPLALAALHQPALGEAVGQRRGQPVGQLALLGAVGGDRPLRRGHVVGMRRTSAHRPW